MRKVIVGIVVVAIFVPYRLSDYGKDSGFVQDIIVAAIAFALGGGLSYLILGADKKTDK